jgi:hypothetical protein
MKKSIGVVIGPSGIGKAHIRELINYGFQNICLLGKKFRKERSFLLNKEYKKVIFHNLKLIKEIKKIKPKVIHLCSPTKYHYDQILAIKDYCKHLIIEKPIFWIKDKDKSNFKIVKNLLNLKSNKIFVNLPMISLATQIRKKEKLKKIKKFNFNYFTNGKNKFEDIPIDLLPHALSFFFTLNPKKQNNYNKIEVNKKKYSWNCKMIVNECLCKFYFKQDSKSRESILSFKINDDTYLRKSFIKNNVYVNKVLKNQKKLINLKNPMSDYLNLIFKNLNKNEVLRKNNDITIKSIQIMEKLINY